RPRRGRALGPRRGVPRAPRRRRRGAGARRLPRAPPRLAADLAGEGEAPGARHAVTRAPTLAILAIVVLGAIAACSTRDVVPGQSTVPDGGPARPAYCSGTGPPILVGDGITNGEGDGAPDNVCSGTIAVRTFVHALCTCEGYATSTRLTTDSFDSAQGPYK